MDVKVGDRVSIDSKKVGQPRRMGTVQQITEGLSGVRYAIRWEDGHQSIMSPRGGILIVEKRARGGSNSARKAPAKARASGGAKKKTAKKKTTKKKSTSASKKGKKR